MLPQHSAKKPLHKYRLFALAFALLIVMAAWTPAQAQSDYLYLNGFPNVRINSYNCVEFHDGSLWQLEWKYWTGQDGKAYKSQVCVQWIKWNETFDVWYYSPVHKIIRFDYSAPGFVQFYVYADGTNTPGWAAKNLATGELSVHHAASGTWYTLSQIAALNVQQQAAPTTGSSSASEVDISTLPGYGNYVDIMSQMGGLASIWNAPNCTSSYSGC